MSTIVRDGDFFIVGTEKIPVVTVVNGQQLTWRLYTNEESDTVCLYANAGDRQAQVYQSGLCSLGRIGSDGTFREDDVYSYDDCFVFRDPDASVARAQLRAGAILIALTVRPDRCDDPAEDDAVMRALLFGEQKKTSDVEDHPAYWPAYAAAYVAYALGQTESNMAHAIALCAVDAAVSE